MTAAITTSTMLRAKRIWNDTTRAKVALDTLRVRRGLTPIHTTEVTVTRAEARAGAAISFGEAADPPEARPRVIGIAGASTSISRNATTASEAS